MGESPGCAPPPQTVNVHGKNVVEKVIARRNFIKHLPHGLRRGVLVGSTRWRRAPHAAGGSRRNLAGVGDGSCGSGMISDQLHGIAHNIGRHVT